GWVRGRNPDSGCSRVCSSRSFLIHKYISATSFSLRDGWQDIACGREAAGRTDVEENKRRGCARGPVRPEFVSAQLWQFLFPALGTLVCADPGKQRDGEQREFVCHRFE